jgi:uncharacterized protein YkwD
MRSVRTLLRGLVSVLLVATILVVPATASASSRQDRTEKAILRAMNSVRSQHGLSRLHVDSALARAADAHSATMLRTGVFSHGSVHARLRRYTSKRAVGETLAWMSRCNSRKVVRMWLNSAAHRHILLSAKFRNVGVGKRSSSARCMVTADFASAH